MTKRAKSISVSQLKAAAKQAAEHAHRKYPKTRVEVEELYLVPWIICGIPIPWPWIERDPDQEGFVQAFAENLAANPALANAGLEGGKALAAIYGVGDRTVVGVQLGAETFNA
jgi:hypothetical protein